MAVARGRDRFSPRHYESLSAARRRCWLDPEYRAKQSAAHKGKQPSPQARANMSIARKGKKLSPEHCAAICRAQNRPDVRAKKSLAMEGKRFSLEHRAKIGIAMKKAWTDPTIRARRGAAQILAIQEGRCCPGKRSVQGLFSSEKNNRTFHYRSLLELRWYEVFERMATVESYSVESVAIPYQWAGATHYYLPDLMVRCIDGTRELVEVKPEYAWHNPQNQAKFQAARSWCERQQPPIGFCIMGQHSRRA